MDVSSQGNDQKRSSSRVLSRAEGKAAAFGTRGVYSQYERTTKQRERRWQIFSTFPLWVV